jgi:GNAT superfamily N-acetyltransferase
VVSLDRHLRDPLSFVVACDDGRVVAGGRVGPDPLHPLGSGEVAILVEDAWQRLGIARPLLRHLAAAAAWSGYQQLVAYPGTALVVGQRLMLGVGATRLSDTGGERHLHATVPVSARLGLGARSGITGRHWPATAPSSSGSWQA